MDFKDVAQRYKSKIDEFCNGIDPFQLDQKNCKDPLSKNVTYTDIYKYCIEKDSFYTKQKFVAYKSLEAYYDSGWVQWVACYKVTAGAIILASVKHSMKTTIKPLKCWIALDQTGIVLCGHCTCMAGCGEVCSHIGAALFALEAWTKLSQDVDNPVRSTLKTSILGCGEWKMLTE